MKIKIEDVWYDTEEVPVLIILEKNDVENIGSMPRGYNKYASFPENYFESIDDVKKWMHDEEYKRIE